MRGVIGKAGVSGRGEPASDVSASVSLRYDENDSSRICLGEKVNDAYTVSVSVPLSDGIGLKR